MHDNSYSVFLVAFPLIYGFLYMVIVKFLPKRWAKKAPLEYPKLNSKNHHLLIEKHYDMNMSHAISFISIAVAICAIIVMIFIMLPDNSTEKSVIIATPLSVTSPSSIVTTSAVIIDTSDNSTASGLSKLWKKVADSNLAFLTFFLSYLEFCRNSKESKRIKRDLKKAEIEAEEEELRAKEAKEPEKKEGIDIIPFSLMLIIPFLFLLKKRA